MNPSDDGPFTVEMIRRLHNDTDELIRWLHNEPENKDLGPCSCPVCVSIDKHRLGKD